MKNSSNVMVVNIARLLVIFGVLIGFSHQAASKGAGAEMQGFDKNFVVDLLLLDLGEDLKVFGEIAMVEGVSQSTILVMQQSIFRKLLLVYSYKPQLPELKGEPLESLCIISTGSVASLLNGGGFKKELVSILDEYFSSFQDDVKGKIADIQSSLKGDGCFIGGSQ
ncbi:hypothetical protein [Teredinibacter purpureus]|uniref:hypothetical protein n=1 Tax=Teredinibacter purpureus TaxID=2731756 RepID=UPI0005F82778|nr:hypothetical protein [Teredinibacter purpureus]